MVNKESIILIGPLATGKSTLAVHLSEMSGHKNYPIDRLKWYYRFKNGYDFAKGRSMLIEEGFAAYVNYAELFFSIKELEVILEEFKGILDLGATDTFSEDIKREKRLKEIFAHFPNIFLILPSPSNEINVSILSERIQKRYKSHEFKNDISTSYLEVNNKIIYSKLNQEIARHVVYTENRDLSEICNEILDKVTLSSAVRGLPRK